MGYNVFESEGIHMKKTRALPSVTVPFFGYDYVLNNVDVAPAEPEVGFFEPSIENFEFENILDGETGLTLTGNDFREAIDFLEDNKMDEFTEAIFKALDELYEPYYD